LKKIYTTLVAAFAIAYFSYGQNTSWSTTGSIGIGTTSLAAKSYSVEDTSTTGSAAFKLTNKNIKITMKKILFTLCLIASTQCLFAQVYDSGSNVGIGTTTPSSALDIAGLLQLFSVNSTTPPLGLSYGLFPYGGVGLGIFSGANDSNQGIGIWTNPGGAKRT
jgi:hypothetical protein